MLEYGGKYDNAQACSPFFQGYLDELVEYLLSRKKLRNKWIVEIGCGNGLFLKQLCERGNNRGLGIDPSYSGPEELLSGRLKFEKKFFRGGENVIPPADAVICRHLIEHEPDPEILLRAARRSAAGVPGCEVFFETPDVGWILENGAFWDFFYEHCSYFSRSSLSAAFQLAGFRVINLRHVFRGQYLWLEACSSGEPGGGFSSADVYDPAKEFAAREDRLIGNWNRRLSDLYSSGGVALWGAGAKGVTFANLLDRDCSRISCVIDVNPNKQGGFIPGTGHPIISFWDLAAYDIATVLVMNSNYIEECRTMLRKAGIDATLIEVETL